MKKKIIAMLLCVCLIVVVTSALFLIYQRDHLKNTVDVSKLNNVKIVDLEPIEYIELPSTLDNGAALTATGISCDRNSNTLFIGNYGKASSEDSDIYPSIISVSQNSFNVNGYIHFDMDSIDIQGIAFDVTNNSFWYTNGDSVINCSTLDASELSSFSLDKYSKYKANGICIDANDDSLWVLCLYKYLLNYDKKGNLLKVLDCEYIGQDHIWSDSNGLLYISAGVDYNGENNYIICINKTTEIKAIYRVKGSYAIEGILILDDDLYVVNDGIYHDAKIGKNYIQIYNIS